MELYSIMVVYMSKRKNVKRVLDNINFNIKRCVFLVLTVLMFIILGTCSSGCKKTTYPLESGVYDLEYAVLTNKATKEVTEKSADDILNDKEVFKEWCNLFSFQAVINADTEYFCTNDNRVFVLNEGLAFEVIGTNTLKLHFPHWCGYDFYAYDIVIILVKHMAYR